MRSNYIKFEVTRVIFNLIFTIFHTKNVQSLEFCYRKWVRPEAKQTQDSKFDSHILSENGPIIPARSWNNDSKILTFLDEKRIISEVENVKYVIIVDSNGLDFNEHIQ